MGAWDRYEDRINAAGGTKRGSSLQREIRFINSRLPDSLSYQTVKVFTQNNSFNVSTDEAQEKALTQNVAIINSDNLNEKNLITLPGEDMDNGNLIYWVDNYWLVTERDANTTVYTKTKLVQCNHLLKWINDDKQSMEQWCMIEDGTKLKHIELCNSLVYRKRYAKRTSLIAGNPLEPYYQNRTANSCKW